MREFLRRSVSDLPVAVTTALLTSTVVGFINFAWEYFLDKSIERARDDARDDAEMRANEVVALKEALAKEKLGAEFGQDAVDQVYSELPPGPFLGVGRDGGLMLYADPEMTEPLLPGAEYRDWQMGTQ